MHAAFIRELNDKNNKKSVNIILPLSQWNIAARFMDDNDIILTTAVAVLN